MKKYLAVDGGWSGAAAYSAGGKLGVTLCPGDAQGIIDFLRDLTDRFGHEDWIVTIEANHASPHFGARGNFGLGLNIGSWESALASFNMRWENINPKTWQSICNNERSRVKKGRKSRKEKAWRFARKTFPGLREQLGDSIPNPKNPIQGKADALCILEWSRRR